MIKPQLFLNIDVYAITETWLFNQTSPAILNELIPDGCKFLNHPQIRKKGDELCIIYRKNLNIIAYDSRELKIKNFEYLNCFNSFKSKTFFL